MYRRQRSPSATVNHDRLNSIACIFHKFDWFFLRRNTCMHFFIFSFIWLWKRGNDEYWLYNSDSRSKSILSVQLWPFYFLKRETTFFLLFFFSDLIVHRKSQIKRVVTANVRLNIFVNSSWFHFSLFFLESIDWRRTIVEQFVRSIFITLLKMFSIQLFCW